MLYCRYEQQLGSNEDSGKVIKFSSYSYSSPYFKFLNGFSTAHQRESSLLSFQSAYPVISAHTNKLRLIELNAHRSNVGAAIGSGLDDINNPETCSQFFGNEVHI